MSEKISLDSSDEISYFFYCFYCDYSLQQQ